MYLREGLVDEEVIVLVALVSPYRMARDNAREVVGTDRFIEVWVDCGLGECIKRDTKGMYYRAMTGKLLDFTGIGAPYEVPLHPELHLWTDAETPEESVDKVLTYLKGRRFLNWGIDK